MSGSNGEDYELVSMPSVDSLAEWRCCEQVENGTPSTSSSFWDDDSDDGSGARPSDLFGRLTWKIENYSLTNKRELRSKIFEAGDYKWCVLIYPQGCDVSHHLSLFLCVANHDRLLPGWGHFAQFTIALVNKDPKKSKYSDTLHRFWKKEHDWGWKKFMELTKLPDGFLVSDTLVIKAKVQVIREKAHRLFRCLNFQYRRELVRVYLSHVEQICRRFFEEKRDKLGKLIEDKLFWISFCSFWSGIDQDTKRHMSSDKTDVIFKVVVKHFFVEKEVTSTLVMDSLYSGLKVLEYQSRNKKGRQELLGTDESPSPLIHIEKDMFVLADDVLVLLERVALEPLPCQPLAPKDDSNSQNRLKEGSCGDILYRDSIEREERRLTELGRKTLEFFVLSHIFRKIEVAYQESIALEMQEELIREEEAEIELKAKCGASAKEKRTKKKQAKQRQSNRKGKDRGKNEKLGGIMDEKHKADKPSDERSLGDLSLNLVQSDLGGIEATDNISDVSYNGGDGSVALLTDLEDRDTISVNWEVVDISEIPPVTEASNNEKLNGQMERRSPSIVDDSSSTCSTDSVPSVVLNGPYKGHSLPSNKIRTSLTRGKHERSEDVCYRAAAVHGGNNLSSAVAVDAGRLCDIIDRVKETDYEEALLSFKDKIQWLKQHRVEKESEVSSQQRKSSVKDDQLDVQRPSKPRKEKFQPSISHAKEQSSVSQQMKQSSKSTISSGTTSVNEPASMREATLNQDEESLLPVTRSRRTPISANSEDAVQETSTVPARQMKQSSKSTISSGTTSVNEPASMREATLNQDEESLLPVTRSRLTPISANSEDAVQETSTVPARSRSSGAALVSDSNSAALDAFTVQTLQNEASRSGMEPSNYGPQLDRNGVIGQTAATLSLPALCSSGEAASCSSLASSPSKNPSQTTGREVHGSEISFGSLGQCIGDSAPEVESGGTSVSPSNYQSDNISSGTSSLEVQEVILDDFPHLDIINDLLNEDQIVGGAYYHVDDESSSGDFYVFPEGDAGQHSAQFYDGRFQGFYSSSGADFGGLGRIDAHHYHEYLAECESRTRSQWPQFSSGDFSMLGVDGADAVYPYQLQDYSSNLAACGFSGYDIV